MLRRIAQVLRDNVAAPSMNNGHRPSRFRFRSSRSSILHGPLCGGGTAGLFSALLLIQWLLIMNDYSAIQLKTSQTRTATTTTRVRQFPTMVGMTSAFERSRPLQIENLPPIERVFDPDYGGLIIASSSERRIAPNEEQDAARHRQHVLRLAEENYVSSSYTSYDDLDWPLECVPPAWSYRSRPNCNTFHERTELDSNVNDIKYLSRGHYRGSWLIQEEDTSTGSSPFVLKRLRYKHKQNARSMSQVMTEALIMDGLSASPVVTNMYGHCSTSMAVEAAHELVSRIVPYVPSLQKEQGHLSQSDYRQLSKDGPFSFNNFTAPQKLDIALQMAEGLAEQHGYEKGVIVNNDPHPEQWLITDRGVIMTDMNDAVILDWNSKKEEYCKYWIRYNNEYRAPEAFHDGGSYVDESVDIYPMGNLIHSLLTGLWPFYHLDDLHKIQKAAMKGVRPYLDPRFRTRSMIERRLAELMDQCHALRPEDRVDIFEVVRHLRETKRMHEEAAAA